MRVKIWMSLTILSLLLASCNLPTGNRPAVTESPTAPGGVVSTTVELTTVARLTEIASGGSATTLTNTPEGVPAVAASPTACIPNVVANSPINVRSGPGTAYDPPIGALVQGASAGVAGKSDDGAWWYIDFPGGPGGHGWVSGSVVTAYCIPSTLAIVAAPPLPTVEPTKTPEPTDEVSLPPPVAGLPDLAANGMQYAPDPGRKNQPISIQVRATNNSGVAAGEFTVVWYKNQDEVGCSWTVQGLGAGKSKALSCQTTYTNAPTKNSTYYIALEVDTGQQVAESEEGNNYQSGQLKVDP